MATIEIIGVDGETSTTIKLYPIGSDTLTESVSATAASNRKGVYSATTTAAAGGYHCELIASDGTLLSTQYVDILAAGTFEGSESPPTVLADSTLRRNVANVQSDAAEHSLATVPLALLESERTTTTWTIKQTDGTTTHVTKTLTLDDTAKPVVGVT